MASIPVVRQCCEGGFDLFKCFENPGVCVCGLVCPCVVAGQLWSGKGKNCCLYGFLTLVPIIGCYLLSDLRTQIKGKPLWENCAVGGCLCISCALCQEGKGSTSFNELVKAPGTCCKSAQQVMK